MNKSMLFAVPIILAGCGGSNNGNDTPSDPADPADTAVYSAWGNWTPASNTDTSVIDIVQSRTRVCMVTTNGNTDVPAATCSGVSSQTQTITNPLAADTASWSVWSPASNTDTTVVEIEQTRICIVTVIGNTDTMPATCNANGDTSQTQTIVNPLSPKVDTTKWGEWSAWTPTTTSDSSVMTFSQSNLELANVWLL